MKKLSLLILALVACMLVLGSCLIAPGAGPAAPEPENLIYNADSELYIVVGDATFPSTDIDAIFDGIAAVMDKTPTLTNRYMEGKHNIVIGKGDDPVSAAAYKRLDSLMEQGNDAGFILYSDGSSICIAYRDDSYGFTHAELMDYLKNEFIAEEVIAPKGSVKDNVFEVIDRIVEDEERILAEAWQKLAEATDTDTMKAMQRLYAIYEDGFIDWIISLYDPGTGGFYFSNSGRDNYGFGPDLESTSQALGFLNSCGIFNYIGGSWAKSLPKEMLDKIGKFAYDLQDPDGYFYHPQWGKAIINSRRSRDLSHGVSILKSLGITPKYKTMTGVGGDVDPAGFITDPLGQSSVVAVSRVVSVAGETLIPEHLQTPEAYRAYVNKLFDENTSYTAGHNLSSQATEIKARGKEYVNITIEILNTRQKDNGLWEDTINYTATNGLMKISGVYNSLSAPIPRAELAIQAALGSITTDQKTTTVVQLWNAWAAADRIVKNIETFGNEELVKTLRAQVIANSTEYLDATVEKLLLFLEADGSFCYNAEGGSGGFSQSAPVSIKGTPEGDVNGATIAVTSMTGSIYSLMGVSAYKVPIYTETDRIRMMEIIGELTPIVKSEPDLTDPDPETYDDLYDGAALDETVNLSSNFNNATASIVSDPRGAGKAVAVTKGTVPADKSGDSFYISALNANGTGSCSIIETEMCIASVDSTSGNIIEFYTQNGSSKIAYCLYFYMSGDTIIVKERGTKSAASFDRDIYKLEEGEWFKLRIEYYAGDHDTVRVKVRINDELIAVSDNYYDANGVKISGEGTPESKFTAARLFLNKTPAMTLYFDNARCYMSNATYTPEQTAEGYDYNIDAPAEDEIVYDFSDGIPAGATVAGNAIADNNGRLAMTSGATVTVPATTVDSPNNCVSLSACINVPRGSSGKVLELAATDINNSSADLFRFVIRAAGGSLTVTPIVLGGEMVPITLQGAEVGTEFNLWLDYYPENGAVLIYVDGTLIGVSRDVASDASCRWFKSFTVKAHAAVSVNELMASRTEGDFDSATESDTEQKVEDFERGKGGVSTSGTIVDRNGDKMLALNGMGLTMQVNDRAMAKNASVFAFAVDFSECDDGEGLVASILNESGDIIFALKLLRQGNTVRVYEMCEYGDFTESVLTLSGVSASLSMNYYPQEGALVLCNGSTPVLESRIFYCADTSADFGAECSILTDGKVYLDDLIAENVTAMRMTCTGNADIVSGDRVTFESSSVSSMPNRLTVTLVSAGSSSSIKAMLNAQEEATKVLTLDTKKGGIDKIDIEMTKSTTRGTAYRFEAAIKIDTTDTASVWQLKLMAGDATAYLLFFNVSGSSISFVESSHENANDGDYSRRQNTYSNVATVGEWFTVTVEYTVVGSTAEISLYADGELLGTSDYFYGSHVPGASAKGGITGASLRSFKDRVSTIYVDDIIMEKYEP